jgi:uncharacterized membrane protein AbrB (regulator of aidB expression)
MGNVCYRPKSGHQQPAWHVRYSHTITTGKTEMDTQAAPKKNAMLGLLIQVAVIGGVAGYLITSPEPWAKYGLV